MSAEPASIALLSNTDLVATVSRLAMAAREATADLIAALAEFDERRLYLGEGYSSLFAYCTERLHLSEWEAYHRIAAARAGGRFPAVLDTLRDGRLTMSAVGLLAPHLTEENVSAALAAASYRTKREVEALVANLQPRPEKPSSVRQLPDPAGLAHAGDLVPLAHVPASSAAGVAATQRTSATESGLAVPLLGPGAPVPAAAARPALVRAVAPARYQISCTVSADTHDKFRRAQDLLRHVSPDGDPAVVLDRALSALIRELERAKFALTDTPRTTSPSRRAAQPGRVNASRAIPAAVKRAVWSRDGGQCTFVGTGGRCAARGRLEFHHRIPFADGGTATVENIALTCAAHNRYEDARWAGERRPG